MSILRKRYVAEKSMRSQLKNDTSIEVFILKITLDQLGVTNPIQQPQFTLRLMIKIKHLRKHDDLLYMLLKRASDPGYLHKNGSQIGKLNEKYEFLFWSEGTLVAKLE